MYGSFSYLSFFFNRFTSQICKKAHESFGAPLNKLFEMRGEKSKLSTLMLQKLFILAPRIFAF